MKSPIKISVKIGSKTIKSQSVNISQSVVDHHTFAIFVDATEISNKDAVIKAEEVYDVIAKPVLITITNKNDEDDRMDFKGTVNSIDIDKEAGNYDTLVISGRSNTMYVDDHAEVCTYSETTFANIAKEVLSDFDGNLIIDVSPSIKIDYCVQYNETAFDFVSRLAFQYGLWFYYNGKDMIIGKYSKRNEYNLSVGNSMQSFEIALTMLPLNYGYSHYNYIENNSFTSLATGIKKPDIGKYAEGTLDASFKYYNRKPLSVFKLPSNKESIVDQFTKSRVDSGASQMVLLSGFSGNPGLGIGAVVEVKDQDGDNMGNYNIVRITHSWNGEGRYKNNFEGIPSSIGCPIPNPNVRIPKSGNQIATIVENADPDNMGRVRVRFPWQDQNSMTPWIRVTYPYAGGGDSYFCPEIDDQVMVGFEMNNPDRPFVMGSVYHGKNKPQYASDDNTVKAIHTKCGHRIIFEDGDDSMISIYTKDDKNHIVLDVADDGQISITTEGVLNLKGKTINLEGDELNIKMDSAINMEAGQDVSMKGANVAVKADQVASLSGMEAKISGDTSAEMTGAQVKVEASAMAVLKGAMVNIN